MLRFAAFSFALGASALTVPRSTCSFELTASGGKPGTLGQLPDGQIRIGGGFAPSTFTIDNGGIIDAAGRGCILTPAVEQFQCDQGVGPRIGFAIDSNGTLLSSGNPQFFACPASETEWNVYTTPVIGQKKCVDITLTASDCGAPAPPPAPTVSTVTITVTECPPSSVQVISTTVPPPPPPPPATNQESTTTTTTIIGSTVVPSLPPTPPSSTPAVVPSSSAALPTTKPTDTAPTHTPTMKPSTTIYRNTTTSAQPTKTHVPTTVAPPPSCPTTLMGSSTSGNFEFPHLMVPISSSTPDTAAGTSFFGTISPNTSTIFNFDIPPSYASKTCSLIFLLPNHADLQTSSYTLSGSGAVDFEKLSSVATQSTTWNNAPSVSNDLGSFTLTEGSSTLVSTFSCPAGTAVAYEMKSIGDTSLVYFQDFNPSPIGLYITVC